MPIQLQKLFTLLLDLLFPIECLGCGREGEWLCEKCNVFPAAPRVCPFCHQANKMNTTCDACQKEKALDALIAVTSYQAPLVHEIIHGYKFKFWKGIYPFLGKHMARSLTEHQPTLPNAILVPIPLHSSRLRFRGFNQSAYLSRVVAEETNLISTDALLRVKATQQQARLQASDRIRNLANAFQIRPGLDFAEKSVILIDDVFTTGATLAAAAQVCKQAGAKRVWGLVFAKGLKNTDK
ncbi:MAG: ComF family protein [Candidatus Nomurabacteria bacterium]|nr:MAG: ComF family protein [Candidatus Nomurabacteria bacterium]